MTLNGRRYEKQVEVNLKFISATRDSGGRVISSGIESDIDMLERELVISVAEDQVFDWESDSFVNSGKLQINLSGTRRSLFELGKLFLALSIYEDDPEYHTHIDNIRDKAGREMANLILHVPHDGTAPETG